MNTDIQTYVNQFPDDIIRLFSTLRDTVFSCVSDYIEEKMWAKLPSYYSGEKFIRLIPFKDHINIEASSMAKYKEKLNGYKLTPKGMLQIFPDNEIPTDILKQAFKETLK